MAFFPFMKRRKRALEQMDDALPGRQPTLLALEPRILFDATVMGVAGEGVMDDPDLMMDTFAEADDAPSPVLNQEVSDLQALFIPPTPLSPAPTGVLFVDPTIDDYEQLITGLAGNVEVVVLDAQSDGVAQITDWLAGNDHPLSEIHILSHGDSGSVQLGNAVLDGDSLTGYTNSLSSWSESLTGDADILIYGCNVGSDAQGLALLDSLSELTGADVAASDDLTGSADQGGDWELEVATGAIQAESPLSFLAMESYSDILATVTWDGDAGDFDWNTASNWDTDTTPTSADDVVIDAQEIDITLSSGTAAINSLDVTGLINLEISGGTLDVATASTVNADSYITLSSGAIDGTGSLSVGNLVWTGGSINSDGGVTVTNTLDISGASVKYMSSGTLSLSGTGSWSDGDIRIDYGSLFEVQSGATLTINGGDKLYDYYGDASSLDIYGDLIMNDTGMSELFLPVNNSGTITITAGTLVLSDGGSYSGDILLDDGAILQFDGGTHVLGDGVYIQDEVGSQGELISGTITVSADATAVISLDSFTMSGGTLDGEGALEISGSMVWTGGSINSDGSVTFSSTYEISGTSEKYINSGNLYLSGTGTWSDGNIRADYASLIQIDTTGALTITGDDKLYDYYGDASSLTIYGSLTMDGTGNVAYLTLPVVNYGTITTTNGTLVLDDGGTQAGSLAAGTGTDIVFDGGTHTWQTDTILSGLGTVEIKSGTVTLDTEASVTSTVTTFSLTSGTLDSVDGSETLSVANMEWAGGTIGATGLAVTTSLDITSSATKVMSGGTLTLTGAGVWDDGDIRLDYGSNFIIDTGGSLDIQGDVRMYDYYGDAGLLTVTGTLSRSTSTGSASLELPVTATGSISVDLGTLELNDGGTIGGSLIASVDSTLLFDGGTFTWENGLALTGSGTVEIGAGTVNIGAVETVTSTVSEFLLSGGALDDAGSMTATAMVWTAGTIGLEGGLDVTTTLEISGSDTHVLSAGYLIISGAATWTEGNIRLDYASDFEIDTTGSLEIQGDTKIYNYYGDASYFWNYGTVDRTTGTGTASIEVDIYSEETSTISVSSGILELNVSGSYYGTLNADSGGTLLFDGGTHYWEAGLVVSGLGTVELSSGTISVEESFFGDNVSKLLDDASTEYDEVIRGDGFYITSSVSTLLLDGATLTGNGLLDVDHLTWTSGTISVTYGIYVNTSLEISGTGIHYLDGGGIVLDGSGTWTEGNIRLDNAGYLEVYSSGSLDIQGDVVLYQGAGTDGYVNNLGTILRSTSTGTAEIRALFDNDGTLQVSAGTLEINDDGTHYGVFQVDDGATLLIDGGTQTLATDASLSGLGTIEISNGTVTTEGDYSFSGTVSVSGGSLEFNVDDNLDNLSLSSGSIGGSGIAIVNTTMDWTGGTIDTTGDLQVNGALDISGSAIKYMDSGNFSLAGSGTWDEGKIYLNYGSTFTVDSGATLDIQGDLTMDEVYNSGVDSSLIVDGTVTKSTGTETAYLQLPVDSIGTISVTSGTLAMNTSGYFEGDLSAGDGATLLFDGGSHEWAEVVFSGLGTVEVASGTITIGVEGSATSTAASFLLSGGTIEDSGTLVAADMAWTGGTIGIDSLTVTGSLDISGSATKYIDAGGLTLSGDGVWDEGNIRMDNGASWSVSAGGSLDIQGDIKLYHSYGTDALFDLEGSLTVSTSTGTTEINTTVDLDGAVYVKSGTLEISDSGAGDGSHTGTMAISADQSVLISAGDHVFSALTVTGDGALEISGGSAELTAAYAISNLAVSGGTLNLNNTAIGSTIASLSLSSGTVEGAPVIVSVADMSWTGGTISTTTDLSVVDLAISGSAIKYMSGGMLEISGDATWDEGHIYLNYGSTLTIADTGTLDIQGDLTMDEIYGAGTNTLINEGTLLKSSGTGTAYLQLPVDNSGTLNVTSGILAMNISGSYGGTLSAGTDASLLFDGGTHTWLDGLVLSGLGTVEIASGTVNIGTGESVTSTMSSFLMSDGILDGLGSMSASYMDWTGGTMALEGGLTVTGTLDITGTALRYIDDGGILNVFGSGTWIEGNIRMDNGAAWNIDAGATLDIQDDVKVYNTYGTALLTNSGTLIKSTTTGTAELNLPFDNDGTVKVTSGTLEINDDGSHDGTFNVDSGQTLLIDGGYQDLFGAVSGLGTIQVNGGTLDISGDYSVTGTVSVTGGTVYFESDDSLSNLSISSGTVGGGGTATVDTAMTWTGGYLENVDGNLIVAGTLDISGSSGKYLNDTSLLTLSGTGTWDEGTIYINYGSTFTITSGATLDIQGDLVMDEVYDIGTNYLVNAGTIIKSTGDGTAYLFLPVESTGTIEVTSGTLETSISGDYGGTLSVSDGAALYFGSGTHNWLDGLVIDGLGTVEVGSGTINIATEESVTSTVGDFLFSGGTLDGAGSIAISDMSWSGGTVAVEGGVEVTSTLVLSGTSTKIIDTATFTLSGAAIWSEGNLLLNNAAIFSIASTGSLDIQDDLTFYDDNTGVSLINAGTIEKSAGDGTALITSPMTSTGTVSVTSGILEINDTATFSGTLNAGDGATLLFDGDTQTWMDGLIVSGLGTVEVRSGTISIGTGETVTATVDSLLLSGGEISGLGTLSAASLDWTGGTLSLGGGVVASLTLDVSGTAIHYLTGTDLTLSGDGTWIEGNIILDDTASITIDSGASFDIQDDVTLYESGSGAFLNNLGTLIKSTSTGSAEISIDFDNDGTVSVTSGTLELSGDGDHSGTFSVDTDQTLLFNGTTQNLLSDSVLSGLGTITLASGAVGLSGSYGLSGTLSVTGGSVTVNTDDTLGSLSVSGGILAGAGVITTDKLTWSDGEITHTGGITTDDLYLTGAVDKVLTGGTLTLAESGSGIWDGGGLDLDSGAAFTIKSGSSFDIQGDYSIFASSGTASWTVAGDVTKSAGTGSFLIDVPLELQSTGSITVSSGTVELSTTSATLDGTIRVDSGTTFDFGTVDRSIGADGVLAGHGTLETNGNTLTVNGTISPGSSPGTLTISGNLDLTSGATIIIELADTDDYDALVISGNADLAGEITVTAIAAYDIAADQVYAFFEAATTAGNFGAIEGLEGTIDLSDPSNITVTLAEQDFPPIAIDDAISTPHDTPITTDDLTANDYDSEGLALTVSAVTQGSNGSVTNHGDGTFTYTPDASFTGTDTFTYTITDDGGSTDEATVTVTVTSDNSPPQPEDDSDSVVQGESVTIDVLSNDVDYDDDTLTISAYTQPDYGSIVLNGDDTITYTAPSNYSGSDTFTYTVDDGNQETATATVTISVSETPNNSPTAVDDTATTEEERAITLSDLLDNDSDRDGDSLSISSVGQGSYGTVVDNGDNTVTYTPDSGFIGTDTFTYRISDGSASDTATVTITVTAGNDPPVATDDSLDLGTGQGSRTIDVLANDSDPEGGDLTISSYDQGSYGTVSHDGSGTFTYTPGDDFAGSDSFTYTISDSDGATATATVTVSGTTSSDNTVPEAIDDQLELDSDQSRGSIDVLSNDFDLDEDTLTLSEYTQGRYGTVVDEGNGVLSYTPGIDFIDSDSFTYTITDSAGDTATATVTVTVASTTSNSDPIAEADLLEIGTGQGSRTIDVLANDSDPDGDTLTISDFSQGVYGSVVHDGDGVFTYTPADGFTGSDYFTYTVSDGLGGTATATVTVKVSDNTDPTAVDDSVSMAAGEGEVTFSVLDNDTDPDGDTLSVTDYTEASFGTVVHHGDGRFTYTPADGFTGSDYFTYTVSDGLGGTATATVTVEASASDNTDPIAVDDSVSMAAGEGEVTFSVLDNDTDPDGDTLIVTDYTEASFGTVVHHGDGRFIYTPENGFSGTDRFTYTVEDGLGGSATATVTIDIAAETTVLTAEDDAVTTVEDFPLRMDELLENDSGTGELTITGFTQASHGTVINIDNDSMLYIPEVDFAGSDSFTYTLTDESGETVQATVTITVTAVNDSPLALDDSYVGEEDKPIVTGNVLNNDGDVEGSDLTIISFSDADHGTVVYIDNGSFIYTPDAGYSGSDSFTYTVTDEDGAEGLGTVFISILAVNDAPTAVADEVTTDEDQAVVIDPLANDTDDDGDTLTLISFSQGSYGDVIDNGDGTLSYEPDADFFGTDTFTYSVDDGNNATAQATVTIHIEPVNDAPKTAQGISDLTVESNVVFVYTLDSGSFYDPDADDSLTYQAMLEDGSALPAWLSFNGNTGTFSGTAQGEDAGSYTIEVKASDGHSTSDALFFTLTVHHEEPDYIPEVPDTGTDMGDPTDITDPADTTDPLDGSGDGEDPAGDFTNPLDEEGNHDDGTPDTTPDVDFRMEEDPSGDGEESGNLDGDAGEPGVDTLPDSGQESGEGEAEGGEDPVAQEEETPLEEVIEEDARKEGDDFDGEPGEEDDEGREASSEEEEELKEGEEPEEGEEGAREGQEEGDGEEKSPEEQAEEEGEETLDDEGETDGAQLGEEGEESGQEGEENGGENSGGDHLETLITEAEGAGLTSQLQSALSQQEADTQEIQALFSDIVRLMQCQ
ncbi:MAG: tandem-95 repeat protein [Magnetococcales bacterium]|nr:tandem-95 repeat protein [Magnetococcales bacterium]